MSAQLRRYRIAAGKPAQFAEEWRRSVLPLRQQYGFRVQGWLVDGTDEFVWLLEHDDRAGFEAADEAYYASADRKSFDPDPARLIVEAHNEWLTPVR
jgi:hypothetical protein